MRAQGRRIRRVGAAALAVALVAGGAACGDDPIVDLSPMDVTVDQLVEDPDAYDREAIRVEGTVAREIDDPPGAVVFEQGDLLVLAPMKPDDVPQGTDVRVTGTFHEFDFQDPGAIDFDEIGQPLADFDGEWAVFATDFEVLAPPGADPGDVPAG